MRLEYQQTLVSTDGPGLDLSWVPTDECTYLQTEMFLPSLLSQEDRTLNSWKGNLMARYICYGENWTSVSNKTWVEAAGHL